jgi:peptide-methionine (S)-S-oxide reductase
MSKTLLATIVLALVGLAFLLTGGSSLLSAAEEVRVVPPPTSDEVPASATSEVAVLAGGCFWGVQGVYQHVKGVTSAVSGYAGGDASSAEYERVGSGRTGHAESVQITFDPRVISYGRLLQVFFSVVHDPTQKNRQGPDSGTQYRSAIFPTNAEQARVAQAYIAQLGQAKAFKNAVATTLEPGRSFYPAEPYHQDYLTLNPASPYIFMNDRPKVLALERLFPTLYRSEPVLVSSTAGSERRTE